MRHCAHAAWILGAVLLGGCSTTAQIEQIPSTRCRHWLDARGGLVHDEPLPPPLVAAGEALLGEDWRQQIVLGVIDSPEVAAYAWPRRHVFVTRGLLDAAPDDELIAALAHELGHLIDDGHVRPPLALRGAPRARGHDIESRADAIGCAILCRAGHDASAMERLLQRLSEQYHASSPTGQLLAARLQSLGITHEHEKPATR